MSVCPTRLVVRLYLAHQHSRPHSPPRQPRRLRLGRLMANSWPSPLTGQALAHPGPASSAASLTNKDAATQDHSPDRPVLLESAAWANNVLTSSVEL